MSSRFIVKANGDQQKFSRKKLASSLMRCGLDSKQSAEATDQITKRLGARPSSREIYDHCQKSLFVTNRPVAYRYSLKKAIFELGPTGFPFEQLIARVFQKQGAGDIKTNLMISGKCVSHEVDVIVNSPKVTTWVECKFHNVHGLISDLKTVLYVFGRYIDLKENHSNSPKKQMCIATNTRFSQEAIQFSECRGMKLLGWEYPSRESLNALLERYQLYPITVISELKRHQKLTLIKAGVLTTQDFQMHHKKVLKLGVSDHKWQEINSNIARLHEMTAR